MFVCRDAAALPAAMRGGAVAIGNFDGLHPGHLAVLAAARRAAASSGAPLGVLTFEPHPRRLFRPDAPAFRLTPPRAKLVLLRDAGVDFVVVQRFNRAFASQSADSFVHRLLREGLGVSHVAVGSDFCYGQGRSGDRATLGASGAAEGFGVHIVPPALGADGTPYASTRIREALAEGAVDRARLLLGRPFTISGHVRHGDKRGRLLGFPTANVALGSYFRPRFGVYAVRCVINAHEYDGVANLGERPTVGGTQARLEVHLFDCDQDLYGLRLESALIHFIRPEQRFDRLDALRDQIQRDADSARDLLSAA
jgi:riboflavin kinase/FMN adenylyltransferase